jgi:ATP-dependent protease Clp ATPase subunit
MYDSPSMKNLNKVIIDKKVVLGETEPLLIYDKETKKKPDDLPRKAKDKAQGKAGKAS